MIWNVHKYIFPFNYFTDYEYNILATLGKNIIEIISTVNWIEARNLLLVETNLQI